MDLYKLACGDCVSKKNLAHSRSRTYGRCEFCYKPNVECRLSHKVEEGRWRGRP